MTILRMQASFGCLQNAVLDLSDGLNILTLPNEAGKSTWAQFLLAMFYGVDTGERAKAGLIPVKTKYKPWSGAPMEGTLELEWNGRVIVLERTSRGRIPMGQFRAYEKATGAPVEALTGENCGRVLLGVERSVLERSAFVRQLGLAVSADDALEKRLASLVTTGEETVSAAETARRLRERKNRLRHNKTGLIPETAARLEAVNSALSQLRSAAAEQQTLRARQEALAVRSAEVKTILSALDILADRQKLQQKKAAHTALIDANNRLQGAQARVARLPAQQTLQELSQRIAAVDALVIPPAPPAPPPAPSCPEAFREVSEDALMERALQDGRDFDRLTAIRHRSAVWGSLGTVICGALAVGCALLQKSVLWSLLFAALAALSLVKLLLDLRHNRCYEAQLDEADAILTRYDRRSRDEFSVLAADYRAALLSWQQTRAAYERECAQRQRLLDEKAQQSAACMGSAAMLAADVTDLPGAKRAVDAALGAYAGLQQAQAEAAQAQLRYDTISTALAGIDDRPLPEGDYSGYSRPAVQAELTRLGMEQSTLQSRLDQSRGSLAALGDPAALAAEQEQLTGRLAELTERYAAMELAEQALQTAAAEVQGRFSPALTREAGRIFSELTGGRYDRARIDRQLSLEAARTGEAVLQASGYFSAGTQDALYLALRLAVARLALPAGTPLVLDDALVCFDDARLAQALTLLRREAASRQILLFTCQSRESNAMSTAQTI